MADCANSFQLLSKVGDLFACGEDEALVHCVSEDMRMGKGIALIFKKKFSGVQELKNQGKKTGEVAVLKRESRFIYYLVTKPLAYNKPTYDTLTSSLRCMKEHCVKNNVSKMSMPRIGCGLDGLSWDKVSSIICDVFSDTNMTIVVYTLPNK